jgi:hypothetical protein
MKPNSRLRGAAAASLAMLLGACAEPVPEQAFNVRKIESAPAAGDGAVRVKLQTPGNIAEADADLILNYVQIVAIHQATKRQQQIAETRARAAWRKMAAQPRAAKKKPRYLAVATEKSTTPPAAKAAASVMLWDTTTQEIVGNGVYEIRSTPRVGASAQFQTYTAEYVGDTL